MEKEKPVIDAAAKKAEMKAALAGKTTEQKKVVKYFYSSGGCLSKSITDEEYAALVDARKGGRDFKAMALQKLSLEESQVLELAPVCFEGFDFDGGDLVRKGRDGVWRSNRYQIAWLFFSADRVYMWRYAFGMTDDTTDEAVRECAFKDVSNFSVVPGDAEREVVDQVTSSGKVSYKRVTVDNTRFALIVSGDRFTCALTMDDKAEEAIRSMKLKLREKKTSK